MIDRPTLGPRELAGATGVSTDTLRYYERCGVLARPARTQAGYRRYPREAVARVVLVRRALTMGFSIKELAGVFRERDRGGAPCRRVRAVVAGRLVKIDAEIVALQELKKQLTDLLAEWDAKLAKTPPNAQARLLDALPVLHTKPSIVLI